MNPRSRPSARPRLTPRSALPGDERPKDRIRFEVHVIPRAARAAVGPVREGALVVRVTAPPVEGAANEAVVHALATALRLAPSDVAIERGGRGRRKLLSVPAAARERLTALK
ncbi:MAG: DUF167 domain-containing protein [Chloroflexi bacterium]|nr:DUF167 domain-containing protein [Chloroflexota bacterium]